MTVFNSDGRISTALARIQTQGGPELDILALAREAEVPVEWLYQLDQGQLAPIKLDKLERLCRILGRSPNDLLGYEADE
jgi:DNA-binding Xre family transcriptional regulator